MKDVIADMDSCQTKIDRLARLRTECSELHNKHPADAVRALRELKDNIQVSDAHDRPGESTPFADWCAAETDIPSLLDCHRISFG